MIIFFNFITEVCVSFFPLNEYLESDSSVSRAHCAYRFDLLEWEISNIMITFLETSIFRWLEVLSQLVLLLTFRIVLL